MKKKNKICSILGSAISYLIIIFAFIVIIKGIICKVQNKQLYIFGYSVSVVVTDSMTPTINVGELVIVKKYNINNVSAGEKGDIICYRSLYGTLKGKNILHRAIEKFEDINGKTVLKTQGDKEGAPIDQNEGQPLISSDNFIGVMVFHSVILGKIVLFFNNPINWIFIVVITISIIVAIKSFKKIKQLDKTKEK